MTAIGQHECITQVDNASNSLTSIQSGLLEVTLPEVTQQIGKHTTFGNDWTQTTKGGMDSSDCTLKIRDEQATSTAYDLLIVGWGASATRSVRVTDRTVQVDRPDSSTGSLRTSFEAGFKSYKTETIKAGSGDAQMTTINLTPNGAITTARIA